ncbi:uncharacterized protein LOC141901648 [Tubulanus polymorphus]|uniref:uncharacterized protein LOC141901648 n=1 Tax=Tubulanus polymorphus TaxID=672921 RepID=UPI003DA60DDF
MDDLKFIDRLDEVQKQALQDTETQQKQWKTFESDYMALKDRLKTLPDEITHDVMVPFGPIAFMPGKLVHTNEVLVLLGDNWFVDRSAKQSCEIIDRRIKEVQKKLSVLDQQRTLLLGRSEFTEQLKSISEEKDKYVEIKEEYNEEEERKWKEKHRENVRKYRHEEMLDLSLLDEPVLSEDGEEFQAIEKLDGAGEEPIFGRTEEDAEIWMILDRLEKQEDENREMERLSDAESEERDEYKKLESEELNENAGDKRNDDDNDSDDRDDDDNESIQSEIDSDDSKSVTWKDFEDEERIKQHRPNKIHFSHSPESSEGTDLGEAEVKKDLKSVIASPGDIYRCFAQQKGPKSILKTSSGTSPHSAPEPHRDKIVSTGSVAAFSGTIVERTISQAKDEQKKPVSPSKFRGDRLKKVQDSNKENVDAKPVSKFKAQRQTKT